MNNEKKKSTDDMERVCRNVMRWLADGRTIRLPGGAPGLDGAVIRWVPKGTQWQQGAEWVEAARATVLTQVPVTRGRETVAGWTDYCGLDTIPALLDLAKSKLDPQALEDWYVRVCADIALHEIHRSGGRDRRQAPPVCVNSTEEDDAVAAPRMR